MSIEYWNGDWAWSLPLIVITVVLHVCGLGIINAQIIRSLHATRTHRDYLVVFALVMAVATLLATLLHGIEAMIWAGAYCWLGAIPDAREAVLYSLSAITTYGHADLFLEDHWQLMGAFEALNGMLLFGLTTAFLYGMIQRVWPVDKRTWTEMRTPWREVVLKPRDPPSPSQ